MMTLGVVFHSFDLATFVKHLGIDGIGALGGYYARGFCKHPSHRLAVGVFFWLASTFLLVSLVG